MFITTIVATSGIWILGIVINVSTTLTFHVDSLLMMQICAGKGTAPTLPLMD